MDKRFEPSVSELAARVGNLESDAIRRGRELAELRARVQYVERFERNPVPQMRPFIRGAA